MSYLPAVNASLNGLCVILLVVGLILIKRKRRIAHRRVMISAFGVSALFLISYVTHWYWRKHVMGGTYTRFHGQGLLKTAYYAMLITHVLLAMTVPVLAIWLIRLGLKGRYDRHKRIARVAYPIWMYVSVTGVIIYIVLYHLNPPG